MGGDEGVRVMMAGAALARRRHDGLRFTLFGDEAQIKAALDGHPNLRAASDVVHADTVVDGSGQAERRDPQEVQLDEHGDCSGESG